jgi:hypothetical protein
LIKPYSESDLILQSTAPGGMLPTKIIYKTRYFTRWARKTGLNDSLLETAVLEIQKGLLEADLGGGIVKKRIALPGRGKRGSTRTLLATNRDDRWFFVFGFEKNERENISENELATLKMLAKDLLGMAPAQLADAIGEGSLVEVEHEASTV